MRNQALIGVGLFVIAFWLAWQVGGKIAAWDLRTLEFGAFTIPGFPVAILILRDWRAGFHVFLIWLLFEDLVRKYLGNNMAIFFAKDVLAGLLYVSLFVEIRKGREK